MTTTISKLDRDRAARMFAGQIPEELWEYVEGFPEWERELKGYISNELSRRPGVLWAVACGIEVKANMDPRKALQLNHYLCKCSVEVQDQYGPEKTYAIAQVLGVLGSNHRILGNFDYAEASYSLAYDELRRESAPGVFYVELYVRLFGLHIVKREFGRSEEAVAEAERILGDRGDGFEIERGIWRPRLMVLRAHLSAASGNNRKACRLFEDAISALDPRDELYLSAAIQSSAYAYNQEGVVPEALRAVERASRLFCDGIKGAKMMWLRGQIYHKAGKPDEAARGYIAARRLLLKLDAYHIAAEVTVDEAFLYGEYGKLGELAALTPALSELRGLVDPSSVSAAFQTLANSAIQGKLIKEFTNKCATRKA